MGQEVVRVGIGVLLIRNGRVLLGERLGSHGAGTWALPGGHLELGETIENCARREVLEETGIEVGGVKHLAFTNDIFKSEGRHYVTLFVLANGWHGEPRVMEPEKCRQWCWSDWDELPSPLFIPLENLKKQGFALPNDIAEAATRSVD
jgi:8-oxo-dGTP diphosphatase